MPPSRLRSAFAAAAAIEEAAPWRSIAHSPIALAIRATRLAGWEFVDATHFLDRSGATIGLMDEAPARVRQLFLRDAHAEELAKMMTPILKSEVHPDEERMAIAEDGLFVDGITRVLQARGKHALAANEKQAFGVLRHQIAHMRLRSAEAGL